MRNACAVYTNFKPDPGLSHFMFILYLLSALFSRVVLPMQAENILPALQRLGGKEPTVKRERTKITQNRKMG